MESTAKGSLLITGDGNEILKITREEYISMLYDRFSSPIFGLLLHWTQDKEIAGKLLRDTFISAWKKMEKYDGTKQRVFTWVYHIAYITCMDYYITKNEIPDRLVNLHLTVTHL